MGKNSYLKFLAPALSPPRRAVILDPPSHHAHHERGSVFAENFYSVVDPPISIWR